MPGRAAAGLHLFASPFIHSSIRLSTYTYTRRDIDIHQDEHMYMEVHVCVHVCVHVYMYVEHSRGHIHTHT